MLPDDDRFPSSRPQTVLGIPVAALVLSDLVRPVFGVGLGPRAVIGTAMPIAPVDEYCDSSRGERNVSPAPDSRHHWSVNSVSQPKSV